MNELQSEVEISYADKRQIYDVQVQLCFSCLSFFFVKIENQQQQKNKNKKNNNSNLKI